MDSLVVVDCQYDFIDGSLACAGAHEAVRGLVDFMNGHTVDVLYTSDWHSPSNQSFQKNGGIWPVHCVAGTKGAALDPLFGEAEKKENRPSPENLFLKGKDDEVEEYSAFAGENVAGRRLSDVVTPHVYVGGIASEYCVRETVLSLLGAGHTVTLLTGCLGYVDKEAHERNLKELAAKGVRLL